MSGVTLDDKTPLAPPIPEPEITPAPTLAAGPVKAEQPQLPGQSGLPAGATQATQTPVPASPTASTDPIKPVTKAEVGQAVDKAETARKAADDARAPKPDDASNADAVSAWNDSVSLQGVADQESAKAEQTIAAYLRPAYQDGPAAGEAASRDVAASLYQASHASWVQQAVVRAQNTVATETPAQRSTNQALFAVNQAGDKVDTLQDGQANGLPVSNTDIQVARNDLDAKRSALLQSVRDELAGVSDTARNQNPDWRTTALGDRYKADPELQSAVQASGIIDDVSAEKSAGASPIEVMRKLDQSTPPSLNPVTRALVTAYEGPGVDGKTFTTKAVVDDYVDAAGAAVKQTLQDQGTVPAAVKLRELTEGNLSDPTALTPDPQVAARVINGLLADGTIPTMFQNLKGNTQNLGDSPRGESTVQEVVNNALVDISAAVDSAAAGSNPAQGRWNSTEIRDAVQGVAKAFIDSNSRSNAWGVSGQAARSGYVTLGLEIGKQLKNLPANHAYLQGAVANVHTGKVTDATPAQAADGMLSGVERGLQLFKDDAQAKMSQATERLAAVLVPAGRYGGVLQGDRIEAGIKQVIADDPTLRKAMEQDRAMIESLGYRMVRVGEAVTFYGQPSQGLGDTQGYQQLDAARGALLDPDQTQAAQSIFLSDSAQRRVATQTLRSEFERTWNTAGVPQAQPYTLGAQVVGDLAEFLSETYVVKGVKGGIDPISNVQATRIAHLPLPVSSGIWLGGGGLQLAATAYFYDNLKFDQGQEWRKPMLLGLVGGFGAFHLAEGAMAMARIGAKPGSWRQQATQAVIEPTKGLVGSLAGLMAIATVWDISGVGYSAAAGDWTKTATHGINLISDTLLLRLQTRQLARSVAPDSKLAQSKLINALTSDGTYQSIFDGQKKALLAQGRTEAAATAEAKAIAEKSASKIAGFLAKVPVIGANPLGWIVNLAYLGTTVVNFAVDKTRAQEALSKHEQSFLSGAGVHAGQANVLKQHGWWSSQLDPGAAGLILGYQALGGDPTKFVDYINAIPPDRLEQLIGATYAIPGSLGADGTIPQSGAGSDLLRLPADPAKVDLQYAPEITRNEAKGRWEDAKTGMVLSDGSSAWSFDRDLGVEPVRVGAGADGYPVATYSPETGIADFGGQQHAIVPTSQSGLANLLQARGIPTPKQHNGQTATPATPGTDPLPPPTLPQPGATAQPAPAPEPSKPANVHVVVEGDTLTGIAGNDRDVIARIYRDNPWLNSAFEGRPWVRGGLSGRNPNQIFVGDVIILPDGYRPPSER